MSVRPEGPKDFSAVIMVTDAAFGRSLESDVIKNLREDGDGVFSLVKERHGQIIGHIQYYKVWIDGNYTAVGLGPVSVHPDHQKKAIGSELIIASLEKVKALKKADFVFLLGHETYYPRFGFCPKLGARFENPFNRPAFMALRLNEAAKAKGRVTLPRAFG